MWAWGKVRLRRTARPSTAVTLGLLGAASFCLLVSAPAVAAPEPDPLPVPKPQPKRSRRLLPGSRRRLHHLRSSLRLLLRQSSLHSRARPIAQRPSQRSAAPPSASRPPPGGEARGEAPCRCGPRQGQAATDSSAAWRCRGHACLGEPPRDRPPATPCDLRIEAPPSRSSSSGSGRLRSPCSPWR